MKKVKLNEQGTPNISSEITLSFENGSQSSQFGQILISELYQRAKPIVYFAFLAMPPPPSHHMLPQIVCSSTLLNTQAAIVGLFSSAIRPNDGGARHCNGAAAGWINETAEVVW